MLSITFSSSVHCDTDMEMIGVLGHNGIIYASIMKRPQEYPNSWLERSPDLKRNELHVKCIVSNSSGIKKQAEWC
jgi:hypothetical protein